MMGKYWKDHGSYLSIVIAGFIPATHGAEGLVCEYGERWVPATGAGMTGGGWCDSIVKQPEAQLRLL
jgi:hypothetical protein